MPDEITWTVSNGSGSSKSVVTSSEKDKVPYMTQLRINEQMTDSQKQMINNYNLMRTTLIKHGLMEDKT